MISKFFFTKIWLRIRVYFYKLLGQAPPTKNVDTPKGIIIELPVSLEPRRPVIRPLVQSKIGFREEVSDPVSVPIMNKAIHEVKATVVEHFAEKMALPVAQSPIPTLQKPKLRFSIPTERKQGILSKLQDSSSQSESGELFNQWRQQSGYPPIWLEELNLTGLKLTGIDWMNCFLYRVKFSHTNLSKASFRAAVLREVDFSQSDLTETNFTGVDLSLVTGLQIESVLTGESSINPWLMPPVLKCMSMENVTSTESTMGVSTQSELGQLIVDQKNDLGKQSQKNTNRSNEFIPEIHEKAEHAERLYKEGKLSASEISQSLGVSKTTFYRYLRLRNVKISKSTRKKN